MLYDETNFNYMLKNFVTKNHGFLNKIPTNLPVKIKVHVYIIKIRILNPIHLMGKFKPRICLDFGVNQIHENFKNNSVEPLIGRCFEFEVKFPSESQLKISIRNWENILGWNDLIGQTVIDLEDRFFSNAYATCGLPKKYEVSGYNEWRDPLQPKQILQKMCKKFGLAPPKYINSKLSIYDNNANLKWESTTLVPDLDTEHCNDLIDSSQSSPSENESLFKDYPASPKEIQLQIVEEQLALDALNSWESIAQVALVPEHLETRSLYNPELGPDLEQGIFSQNIDYKDFFEEFS